MESTTIVERLVKEVESRRTSFKTESYSMSVGELVNLYQNDEIVIRPEYQRLFRWSHGQKVKLVESIMLGIPIPSIFVYQDSSGIWELVDGLQRVSTILQLFGVLKNEDPLVLEGTKHVPSLDKFKWDNAADPERELPAGIKLGIKRAKLDLVIILNESDERAKFEVFQRLNTGGSNASNQEVRNNIMIMVNPERHTWFKGLSDNQHFSNTLSLSDRLYDEQYHMELLLRFIALAHYEYNSKRDVGDFLDDINDILLTSNQINLKEIKSNFEKTFETLDKVLGESSFKRYAASAFKGKFLESAFEVVTVGLSKNIDHYSFPGDNELLIKKVQSVHSHKDYLNSSGSGSNAKSRIPKLIPFAIEHFKR